jgi:hypothetical protein
MLRAFWQIAAAGLLAILAVFGLVYSAQAGSSRIDLASVAMAAALVGTIILGGWMLARADLDLRLKMGIAAGLALVARLGAVLLIGHSQPQFGDAAVYPDLARGLLARGELAVFEGGTLVRAMYPPVFPGLLAGWFWLAGDGPFSIGLLNGLIDGALITVTISVARQLGLTRSGLAAGLAIALWPALLLQAHVAQKESLAVLLVLVIAHGLLALVPTRKRNLRAAAQIGLGTGLLALTQPLWAPVTALLALALLPRLSIGTLSRAALLSIPFALLVLLPWWARNFLLFDSFVPLTSSSGLSLWIANHAGATGLWTALPKELHGLGELDASAQAAAMAQNWIAAHPQDFVYQTVGKVARALAGETFSTYRLSLFDPPLEAEVLSRLAFVTQFAWSMLLALVAAAHLTVRRLWLPLGLVAACLAELLIFGAWFEFGERHRAMLLPFLLIAAAAGIAAAQEGASGKQSRDGLQA